MVALALIEDGKEKALFHASVVFPGAAFRWGSLARLKSRMRAGKCMRDSHAQYFESIIIRYVLINITLKKF